MIRKVTKHDFETEVLQAAEPVLVDFNADWCGPCQMLAPILEGLSEEKKNVKFVSVNVDSEAELALTYNVMSIPCLVLFKNGVEADRIVGFTPKEEIEEFLGK